jgi:ATP-dependent DNA helicase RecQ
LFERLKAWRSEQARAQSVPPYVVFHDSTLSAIASAQPHDLDALSTIAGIGAKKLERYGPALLQLLAKKGA